MKGQHSFYLVMKITASNFRMTSIFVALKRVGVVFENRKKCSITPKCQNILISINKCALNFLLFLVACFTEDQQIWYHTLAKNL